MRSFIEENLHEASEKLRPIGSLLYPLYVWLIVAPIMLVATLLFGIACLATIHFIGPRRANRYYAANWSRIGLWLLGIPVHIRGQEHVNPQQSVVLVANHLSLIDIWLLCGHLPLDLRWVMKQELRQVPVIGICAEKLGNILIDRRHHEAALASLEAAKKQVVNGTSIIFFPEGTRSRDGKLHAFKKGAFHMAIDLNLPVLPVTIEGSDQIIPADSLSVHRHPARLTVHPLIYPDELEGNADSLVDRLLTRCHQTISDTLEQSGHHK